MQEHNIIINSNSNNRKTGIWLPPGFRFHPTDDELITFYLMRKVVNNKFSAHAIADVDLNKYEPWDLPEKANMGEKEWYFFSLRDRKYPTGMRTNRATEAGYWKATGKDRDVRGSNSLVGMKKTLVFYKGRAPRGEKTNWVMHEYRLEGKNAYLYGSRASKEEWVVCRIFQKRVLAAKLKLNAEDDGHDSDADPISSPALNSCKHEYDKELESDCMTASLSYDHQQHHQKDQQNAWCGNPIARGGNVSGFYNSGELARLLDPEFLPALNSHRSGTSSCNGFNMFSSSRSVQLLDNLSFKAGLMSKSCKSEPHASAADLSYNNVNKVMEAASFAGLLGDSSLIYDGSQQLQQQQQQQQQQQNNIPSDQGLNELLFSRFLSDPASSNSSDLDQLYAF